LTSFDARIQVPASDRVGADRIVWFPNAGDAFFHIQDGILAGRLRGERTGPLTWRAIVTRQEIESLLVEIYGPVGEYEARHTGALNHLADRMRALRSIVVELPTDSDFVLAADEF
jgi:hypothetical protein